MKMQISRWMGLFCLACMALAGCESSEPEAGSNPVSPMGDQEGMVAVLPVSDFSYLSDDFQFVYPTIDADVQSSLQRFGVPVVPEATVQAVLNANGGSLRTKLQSKNAKVMADGINDLIWQLRDYGDVTTIIIPQLVIRSKLLQRPYSGASWDGVSRPFVVNGDREAGKQLQVDVATLAVGVYNRFGQAEYFGRGGVDFLENGTRIGPAIYTSPKQPGQISSVSVKEAVDLALKPWVNQRSTMPSSYGLEHSNR